MTRVERRSRRRFVRWWCRQQTRGLHTISFAQALALVARRGEQAVKDLQRAADAFAAAGYAVGEIRVVLNRSLLFTPPTSRESDNAHGE